MTLDQLSMLEAIVEEGSMQKAAKRLYKSQPSLSVGIKKIEELYGIKILSREGYRPSLTREGEVFYQNARQVLLAQRNLHKVALELSQEIETEIKVVIDPLVSLSRIRALLDVATRRRNTTRLIIKEEVLEGPLDALFRQNAHFAVGHCPQNRVSEVKKKRLGQIELVPVVKKGLDPAALPNIVVTDNPDQKRENHPTGSIWHVCSHSRKEELVLEGLGWGRMSRSKVKTFSKELKIVNSKENQKIDLNVYLMIRKDRPEGQVAREMWEAVK